MTKLQPYRKPPPPRFVKVNVALYQLALSLLENERLAIDALYREPPEGLEAALLMVTKHLKNCLMERFHSRMIHADVTFAIIAAELAVCGLVMWINRI
jgi:hypothetical protein